MQQIPVEIVQTLTGQTNSHVQPWRNSSQSLHKEVFGSLEQMCLEAKQFGIDLQICSGFRTFERQVTIWNQKVKGQRPIYDYSGQLVLASRLNTDELMAAILRWSALPGASRHHWGTDFDVFDGAVEPDVSKIELTIVESDVKFLKLHNWLNENMKYFGFFRPYARDLGGISPEPWHLSYAPVSENYFKLYSVEMLEAAISSAEIELKDEILARLPELFEIYVQRINHFEP